MMTTSAHGIAPASGVAAPVMRTARWLSRRLMVTFAWFAGLVALVAAVVAPPVISRYQLDIGFSVWEIFSGNAPAWFLFATGISCVQYLPVLVAQGVTRTNHARATILALALTSLALVAMVLLGFAAESLLYSRLGITPELIGVHSFTTPAQAHLVILEYWTHGMLFALVGLLTGYSYYRFHGLVATALLPITTIIPLGLGVSLLAMDTNTLTHTWGWGPHAATTIGVGVLLLFEAALAVLCTKVAHSLPIRTKAT